ncbi:MAG TPA: leucyl aminopeptidase [Gammaproteobacteria bacterium]|nr:leucyl aminopeptidase [Gammaproteobacteria bacterium]
MDFYIKSGSPEKQRTACVVVPIFSGKKLSRPAARLDEASDGGIRKFLKRGDIRGDKGELAWIYGLENSYAERVLLVGCGAERDVNPAVFRELCETVAKALDNSGATEAFSYLTAVDSRHIDPMQMVRDTVVHFEMALYRFDDYKTDVKTSSRPLKRLAIGVQRRRDLAVAEASMREGKGMALGMIVARDLGNQPPNVCHPSYLASQAELLRKTYPSLELEILDEEDMTELGMGAFMAVSRGSDQPGKLICIKHLNAPDPHEKPVVLVGKGITFDTGGISIKPSAAMDEMKYDMGGAASVFGVITACAELQLPVNVIGVVAAAENMPSGGASRPGDIVKTLSGQTVEILNTDAEGRLVLCDALTWVDRFNPAAVIDIATLTGACIIALGHHVSGMVTNSPSLGRELFHAGQATYDRVWELPLYEEYTDQLKSNFADMANIGGRPAGTITAGAFLSKFTSDYRWAHIDIAGTAWKSGEAKGATGRPVPLLLEFIFKRLRSAE